MSSLHDRLSTAFMMMQKEIKAGSDAKAFQMLVRTVKAEVKKAKGKK